MKIRALIFIASMSVSAFANESTPTSALSCELTSRNWVRGDAPEDSKWVDEAAAQTSKLEIASGAELNTVVGKSTFLLSIIDANESGLYYSFVVARRSENSRDTISSSQSGFVPTASTADYAASVKIGSNRSDITCKLTSN